MAIVVSSVSITLSQNEQDAIQKAIGMLSVKREQIKNAYLIKSSIDARRREIRLVCSIGIELFEGEEQVVLRANSKWITLKKIPQIQVPHGTKLMENRPVVIGFGPAGIFAALLLAQNGYRPIVFERGANMEERTQAVERFWNSGTFDAKTNVQFGEGGAGTFSDGKLTTRIHDDRCEYVLGTFAEHGAPNEIRYQAKPHIGTDRLRDVVTSIRKEILSLGGEIYFGHQMEDVYVQNGAVCGIKVNGSTIATQHVILAIGHSARDTFSMLCNKEILMEPKAFSVGVRIEHLQKNIDRALYHDFAGHPMLGAASYQLSHREKNRAVYTFCMCPGGLVVPSASEEHTVVTNGMSEYARDRQNSNAALVVSVDASDFGSHVMDGVNFQRSLEQHAYQAAGSNYQAPAQDIQSFLEGKKGFREGSVHPSYANGVTGADLHEILPRPITDMMETGLRVFDRKIRGFAAADAVLTGVETRTSSPIRIVRMENCQSAGAAGLYPCGEGAGYAGGIMSAAVDGIRVAQSLIGEFAPKE